MLNFIDFITFVAVSSIMYLYAPTSVYLLGLGLLVLNSLTGYQRGMKDGLEISK